MLAIIVDKHPFARGKNIIVKKVKFIFGKCLTIQTSDITFTISWETKSNCPDSLCSSQTFQSTFHPIHSITVTNPINYTYYSINIHFCAILELITLTTRHNFYLHLILEWSSAHGNFSFCGFRGKHRPTISIVGIFFIKKPTQKDWKYLQKFGLSA